MKKWHVWGTEGMSIGFVDAPSLLQACKEAIAKGWHDSLDSLQLNSSYPRITEAKKLGDAWL